MFCRSLCVLLFFFFWPLCCLSFFDLWILITSLVSSNCFHTIVVNFSILFCHQTSKKYHLKCRDVLFIVWLKNYVFGLYQFSQRIGKLLFFKCTRVWKFVLIACSNRIFCVSSRYIESNTGKSARQGNLRDFPVLHFLPVFDFISHFYQ